MERAVNMYKTANVKMYSGVHVFSFHSSWNEKKTGEVARFPYTKNSENRLKSKAIQGGLRFFYGIQEVCNRA